MKKKYQCPKVIQTKLLMPAQMMAMSSDMIPIGGTGDFSVKEQSLTDELDTWEPEW